VAECEALFSGRAREISVVVRVGTRRECDKVAAFLCGVLAIWRGDRVLF
jgi:hypothetical protein